MLENVFEQGPEDIRILFENLEEQQVGFCLDTGHQSAFSSTALENWANELAPYLGQLHLHDNHGKKDDHLALGRGCIRFETLFATLKRIIKNPPVITLECHRAGDVRPSYEYLAKIWPW
jgi:sugar phosphate isomerase/epimerase